MIVLVGFMGAGKSTVGHLLARRLSVPFMDADDVIKQRHGPIPTIFAKCGEAVFRELEASVIDECLAAGDGVLALGGGAVETPHARDALQTHEVWWLRITLTDALARLGHDASRPVLAAPGLAERFDARQPLYAQVATHTLDVGRPDDDPQKVVERLLTQRGNPILVDDKSASASPHGLHFS